MWILVRAVTADTLLISIMTVVDSWKERKKKGCDASQDSAFQESNLGQARNG